MKKEDFLALIFITLLILKITGAVDNLSWWVVTAPLWIPLAAVLISNIIMCMCYFVLAAVYLLRLIKNKIMKK